MSRDDVGALVPALAPAPAPAPGQVYLPAWRRAYDRLVKMLRQAYRQAEELSVEREHLITEIEFLQISRREREEIYQARIQKVGTIRVPVCGLFLFAIGFGEDQLSAAADAR